MSRPDHLDANGLCCLDFITLKTDSRSVKVWLWVGFFFLPFYQRWMCTRSLKSAAYSSMTFPVVLKSPFTRCNIILAFLKKYISLIYQKVLAGSSYRISMDGLAEPFSFFSFLRLFYCISFLSASSFVSFFLQPFYNPSKEAGKPEQIRTILFCCLI